MSQGVFQPVGQKRLTNIAVVRLKKAGIRFEIACYRNKVGDWRSGVEKDLDEVLQTTSVFQNVGKGIFAKEADLQKAFGTTDDKKICTEILLKGEMQVSDKERQKDHENMIRDVATLLSEKCVNPSNNRPYTVSMLVKALKDVHFSVDLRKNAKQHMLEALPTLEKNLPIQRARMQLRIQVPADKEQELLDYLHTSKSVVESTNLNLQHFSATVQIEPGAFRDVHAAVQTMARSEGRVEVLNLAVMADGDQAALDGGTSAFFTAPQQPTPTQATTDTTTSSLDNSSKPARPAVMERSREEDGGGVVYRRGAIADLPDEFSSRKERFSELDTLQPGWEVELLSKGDTVAAVFFSPADEKFSSFALARRAALAAHKQAAQSQS